MQTSVKLSDPWHLKVYFLKLNMYVYLRAKIEVSNIILTSFRQRERGEGVILSPTTTSKRTPKHSFLQELIFLEIIFANAMFRRKFTELFRKKGCYNFLEFSFRNA